MSNVSQENFQHLVETGDFMDHPVGYGNSVQVSSDYKYGGKSVAQMIDSTDIEAISQNFVDTNFDKFAKEAYDAPEGYAIRLNPVTNEKELFVAGTRDIKQWGLNIVDSGNAILEDVVENFGPYSSTIHAAAQYGIDLKPDLINFADRPRAMTKKHLEDVVRENHIDVVYGHSRGGAIVSDMKVPKGTRKVGLDSAMIESHNTNMLNLNQGGIGGPKKMLKGSFDAVLGVRGKKNAYFDLDKDNIWSAHFSYKGPK